MLDSATQQMIRIEGAATYERILEAVRDDEVEDGILYLQDFLKIYPEFAQAHNDLAVLYYRAGNNLKTLAHYERAHKLDPGNSTYRKNLADFYYVELEWIGEAVHLYSDIVKDNPGDTEALNTLGTIHLQLGRKEKARTFFTKTLQIDARNQDALEALQQLPGPQSGTTARQLSAEPFNTNRQQTLTLSSTTLPTINTAMAIIAPSTFSASEAYRDAVNLATTERTPEAIILLENIIKQDPTHALAHNDLGVLYQRAGRKEQSRMHHEKAVLLQPANTVFQKNLADLLCSEFSELEQALRIYVSLFSLTPTDIELLKAISHICIETGNSADARFFLQQILTIKPWDLEASETLRDLNTVIAGNKTL